MPPFLPEPLFWEPFISSRFSYFVKPTSLRTATAGSIWHFNALLHTRMWTSGRERPDLLSLCLLVYLTTKKKKKKCVWWTFVSEQVVQEVPGKFYCSLDWKQKCPVAGQMKWDPGLPLTATSLVDFSTLLPSLSPTIHMIMWQSFINYVVDKSLGGLKALSTCGLFLLRSCFWNSVL